MLVGGCAGRRAVDRTNSLDPGVGGIVKQDPHPKVDSAEVNAHVLDADAGDGGGAGIPCLRTLAARPVGRIDRGRDRNGRSVARRAERS